MENATAWDIVETTESYAAKVRQWLPELTEKQADFLAIQLHNYDADCMLDATHGHMFEQESMTRLDTLADLFGYTMHDCYMYWIRQQRRDIQAKYHRD